MRKIKWGIEELERPGKEITLWNLEKQQELNQGIWKGFIGNSRYQITEDMIEILGKPHIRIKMF